MSAKSLSCERCGGPVAFQAPFCAYCRAPLSWGASLAIEPGAPLVELDLRERALPGEESIARSISTTPHGRLLTIDGSSQFHGTTALVLRDACVAVTATALEPNVGFGVAARLQRAGGISSAYTLMIHPGARTYRVQRLLWNKQESHMHVLRNWEVFPAVLGVGTPNRVELRFADAVLQVVVNGAHVSSLVDAVFGFGGVGWRATVFDDLPQRKRVLFHAFEVRAVR